ncbi:hypothetical protein BZG36_01772 [Bifiguratus adelaidae]|uniref:DUF427 domain-containing protein n=1 Tax=Bifiguratus adelaidae TaxID=1938954 RepID=A0A261Y306_9FUNG|nr:hypothetical protein BZG36_01772 [Bifiguratus adelaidae]
MPSAEWNGAVLATTDKFETVEGNIYFPPSSIDKQYFHASDHTSHCPWKGDAKYYDVVVNGQVNKNGAWYYPEPYAAAANIKDHVAFWNGITVKK